MQKLKINYSGAKAPKSNSERQAALKKKRIDAGLVRFEIWATPEQKLAILEFAAGFSVKS